MSLSNGRGGGHWSGIVHQTAELFLPDPKIPFGEAKRIDLTRMQIWRSKLALSRYDWLLAPADNDDVEIDDDGNLPASE